jgi:structural maintenance of chromosome 2
LPAQRHKWLKKERDQLGVEGGKYDFGALDMYAKEAEYQKAVADKDALGKHVNRRVICDFERAEVECMSLEARRKTVSKDREAIMKARSAVLLAHCIQDDNRVISSLLAAMRTCRQMRIRSTATVTPAQSRRVQGISELDVQRADRLQRTWEVVNETFGTIFATLLPGTDAKLQTLNGGTGELEDGLEVKVGFGGVWKESLSELSGGQRSLIALSLVFALLKFRPAPIYILDEARAMRACCALLAAALSECTGPERQRIIRRAHATQRCLRTSLSVCPCNQIGAGLSCSGACRSMRRLT